MYAVLRPPPQQTYKVLIPDLFYAVEKLFYAVKKINFKERMSETVIILQLLVMHYYLLYSVLLLYASE